MSVRRFSTARVGNGLPTSSKFWDQTSSTKVSVDYLIVAGGAGGGRQNGGGGGAGGLRSSVTATGGGGTLETTLNLDTFIHFRNRTYNHNIHRWRWWWWLR